MTAIDNYDRWIEQSPGDQRLLLRRQVLVDELEALRNKTRQRDRKRRPRVNLQQQLLTTESRIDKKRRSLGYYRDQIERAEFDLQVLEQRANILRQALAE